MTKLEFEKIKELLSSPDKEIFNLGKRIMLQDKQFCKRNKILNIYPKNTKNVTILTYTGYRSNSELHAKVVPIVNLTFDDQIKI